MPTTGQLAAIALPVVLLVVAFGVLTPVAAQAPAATKNGPPQAGPVTLSGRLIDERAVSFRETAVEVKVKVK